MAGDECHVIAQWPEPLPDGPNERRVVSTREIRPAYGALEKHIPYKGYSGSGMEEHHMSRRMARTVTHQQGLVSNVDLVSLLQPAGGLKRTRRGKAIGRALLGQQIYPEFVFSLRSLDGQPEARSELGDRPCMIDVGMGDQNLFQFEPLTGHHRKQALNFPAWIDKGCLTGLFAPDERAVLLKRGDGQDDDFHDDNSVGVGTEARLTQIASLWRSAWCGCKATFADAMLVASSGLLRLDVPQSSICSQEAFMAIEEGKAAPAFTLKDQDGKARALSEFKGQDIIVYFYPKDDTPGCTKEACGFRDNWSVLQKRKVVVIGISADSSESHSAFIAKYKLPFILLSDPDRKVMEKYEAYGEKMMYGKKTMGVIRSTVWISADGKVRKHWKKVAKAETHPAAVLAALEGG